jgi:lipoate-protein ligase B
MSFNCIKPRVEVRRHSAANPWTYSLLDAYQRRIAGEIRSGGSGRLLISEVAPVITLGRRAGNSEIFEPLEALEARGTEIVKVDRGGLATYHGPGQWVVFLVESLEVLTGDRRGVRTAVEGLLETALEVAEHFKPGQVEIKTGLETGVWSRAGKLASVGVHIEKGVLLHGLSINGYRTAESFRGIRPCGLDAPVDFLLAEPDDREFTNLVKLIQTSVFSRFWQGSPKEVDEIAQPALYPFEPRDIRA